MQSRYDLYKISEELDKTALGEKYYGNALYVARDLPCVTSGDIDCLNRFMWSNTNNTDRCKLQQIAIYIREYADTIGE